MHVVPDNITREKCILLKAPRPLGLGPDFSWVELSVELSVELGIELLGTPSRQEWLATGSHSN